VNFRLLHVFELDGEKIKREQVWCDLAAVQKQLGVVEKEMVMDASPFAAT
jgi:hypothetical protein